MNIFPSRPKSSLAAPPIPVIQVSSLCRGSTGKTPMVLALAMRATGAGCSVHVIMDGPGAPRRIDPRRDRAQDVGDEPLLAAAFATTWIGADMGAVLRAAGEAGAEIAIVETKSAFPYAPNARIAVEDAVRGFGNGRRWPFGSLAVPLRSGLANADLLVTVGPAAAQKSFPETPVPIERRLAHLAPLQTGMDWAGSRVFAFAGIGVPERFFATLHDMGAEVVARHALTNHQELTPALLTRMEREAAMRGLQIVTTEKDAVRLPPDFLPKIMVLPVRLELDDWTPVDRMIAETRL